MKTSTRRLIIATASATLLTACRSPEPVEPESTMPAPRAVRFIPRDITIAGRTYHYAVYVPIDYTPDRTWPAIVFLNGMGERGDDGMKQTTAGIGNAIRANPERFPCIVVFPQLQPERTWVEPDMVDLALACLSAAQSEYRIDPGRIALTGLSLGGYGTWHIGAQHPDKFSSLGPICGGGDTRRVRELAKTPIWCFHGDADPVVPVDESREMVAAVHLAGGAVRYNELPGVTHNSWDAAYGNPEFIAWLLENHKSR